MLLYSIIYFAIVISFYVFEAYVGFGDIEFNGNPFPPLFMAGVMWPLTLVFVVLYSLINSLNTVRERRIKKVKEKKKLRIALEKEIKEVESQLDEELALNACRKR